MYSAYHRFISSNDNCQRRSGGGGGAPPSPSPTSPGLFREDMYGFYRAQGSNSRRGGGDERGGDQGQQQQQYYYHHKPPLVRGGAAVEDDYHRQVRAENHPPITMTTTAINGSGGGDVLSSLQQQRHCLISMSDIQQLKFKNKTAAKEHKLPKGGLTYKRLQQVINEEMLISNSSKVDGHRVFNAIGPYIAGQGKVLFYHHAKSIILELKLRMNLDERGGGGSGNKVNGGTPPPWFQKLPIGALFLGLECHAMSGLSDCCYNEDVRRLWAVIQELSLTCTLCKAPLKPGELILFGNTVCSALYHAACFMHMCSTQLTSLSRNNDIGSGSGDRHKLPERFLCGCGCTYTFTQCYKTSVPPPPERTSTTVIDPDAVVSADIYRTLIESPTPLLLDMEEEDDDAAASAAAVAAPLFNCADCLFKRGVVVPMELRTNPRTKNKYYGCPNWYIYRCKPIYLSSTSSLEHCPPAAAAAADAGVAVTGTSDCFRAIKKARRSHRSEETAAAASEERSSSSNTNNESPSADHHDEE